MSQWQQLCEQYMQLQLRERRLIFFAALTMLLWVGTISVAEPLWRSLQTSQQQQKMTLGQMAQLQQQVDAVLQVLNSDPNEQVRSQINERQQQREQLNSQIKQLTGRYVSPEQMLPLLQDVLKSSPGVKLTQLRSLKPEVLQIGAATPTPTSAPAPVPAAQTNTAQANTEPPAATPQLYLHKTEIIFSGQYAQLQQLLQQLERLPWQLHWHQLEYKVSEHPQAELRLELETISEQAEYLRI
jgi:MSHA biogenesis protein MshJ